jgi:ubiquinone/menaquinone biosynthesis C-methylase UbiE
VGETKKHPYDWQYFVDNVAIPGQDPLGDAFYKFIAELLHSKLQPRSVLDVGSGLGQLVLAFRSLSVEAYGVDISMEAVAQGGQGFFLCDVDNERLPFQDNSFDLVTCIEVVEHLLAPDHFIHEASRVLRPNGFVFLTTPNLISLPHPSFWKVVWRLCGRAHEHHVNEHSAAWWRSQFRKAGFQQVGSFWREFAAFRMKNGYIRLPLLEKYLFNMGQPGRYVVTRIHSLFSANVLFQLIAHEEPTAKKEISQ